MSGCERTFVSLHCLDIMTRIHLFMNPKKLNFLIFSSLCINHVNYVQSLNHSWSVRLTKWWGASITISTSKSWRPSNIMNICISAQSYQPKPRKWSKPQFCFFSCISMLTNYAEHDWWHHQIHETIWDYLHMQHQVDRMNSTRENGQTRRINYAEYA